MHLNKFDLNLLVALDCLLTEKHVSRAAEKLNLPQPAVSAALARLRQYFDDPLLHRVGAKLELTALGEGLSCEVSDILQRTRRTLRMESSFDPANDERELRLIMSDYVASVLMPIVIRRLLHEAPHIRCHVEYSNRLSLLELERGAADLCVIPVYDEKTRNTANLEDLLSREVFLDKFVVVMDAQHRKRFPQQFNLEHFLSSPYVEVRLAHRGFSIIDGAIRQQGVPVVAAAVTASFTAAMLTIPGTPMVTIVPFRLAEKLGPPHGLAIEDSPIDLPQIRELMIWHPRSDSDVAHQWFRGIMQEAAAALRAQPSDGMVARSDTGIAPPTRVRVDHAKED